ncbi:hypothetical protein Tco_0871156 [Tanacetum coccineum]
MVAYLKKIERSEGFLQIVDFLNTSHIQYALTENPTIYVSLIQQFWQTATVSTLDNGEMEITATINGKVKIVTEASIRRHLKLEYSDGISNLPTTEIFEQLDLMGINSPVESHHTPTSAPPTSQPPILSTSKRLTRHESVVPQPRSPTQTNVADEAASTGVDVRHEGAFTTITSLDAGQDSDRVVKKLEKTIKTRQARRKAKIVVSDEEEDLEDPSKQGRKIAEIDEDLDISLVQHDAEVQGRHEHDMEPDFEFTTAEEVYTAEKEVSTAEPVSTAGASVSTTGASSAKDKNKAIMEEAETIQTKTKLQLEQERLARVKADEEFAQRLQSEEREMYSEAEKARLLAELINERKRYFAAQRAKERRNKPLT